MWNTEIKTNKNHPAPFFLRLAFLMGMGICSIVVAVLVLGFGLFEGLMGGGKMQVLQLPGFQELKLDTPGLYAGIYRHRGTSPIPIKAITQMDVRVMSKDDYEEIPVLMNTNGQTFNRMGFQGLPLFNFAISHSGSSNSWITTSACCRTQPVSSAFAPVG